MKPEKLYLVHKAVMDELVPSVIRGTTHVAVYTYLIRFGRAHDLFLRGAERAFLDYCIQCHAQAKNPELIANLAVSDEVKQYLSAVRGFGKGMRAEKAVLIVKAGLARLTVPKPKGALEQVLIDRIGPLALASAESINKFIETVPLANEADGNGQDEKPPTGGVKPGEIFDADLAGMITGAVGAAVATWWTGGAMPAGTALGAAAGAVASSAIEYLEQDAGADAAGAAVVESSTDGGSVWEGGGQGGSEFDSRWHDGDGYGLG